MKLIHVYGDDDYGVVHFEQSDLGKNRLKKFMILLRSKEVSILKKMKKAVRVSL